MLLIICSLLLLVGFLFGLLGNLKTSWSYKVGRFGVLFLIFLQCVIIGSLSGSLFSKSLDIDREVISYIYNYAAPIYSLFLWVLWFIGSFFGWGIGKIFKYSKYDKTEVRLPIRNGIVEAKNSPEDDGVTL